MAPTPELTAAGSYRNPSAGGTITKRESVINATRKRQISNKELLRENKYNKYAQKVGETVILILQKTRWDLLGTKSHYIRNRTSILIETVNMPVPIKLPLSEQMSNGALKNSTIHSTVGTPRQIRITTAV